MVKPGRRGLRNWRGSVARTSRAHYHTCQVSQRRWKGAGGRFRRLETSPRSPPISLLPTNSAAGEAVAAAPRTLVWRLGQYAVLTKARLSAMVVVTTAVGYLLASGSTLHWAGFLWTILGTALAAGGTAGLNQWIEQDRDARMERTRGRPLPSGALGRDECLFLSAGLVATGVAMLAVLVNELAAALALLTAAIYILLYTPLKTRSTTNTLVGAVCGALPPLIGWAAVDPALAAPAWVLAAILFIWQIPHFMALAWMYREDYDRGGYRMLPIVDPSGELTARTGVLTALLLIPVALWLTLLGESGVVFAIGAILLGGLMTVAAARFYRERTRARARGLFLASIVYLPALLGLAVLDERPAVPEDLATARPPGDSIVVVPAAAPGATIDLGG